MREDYGKLTSEEGNLTIFGQNLTGRFQFQIQNANQKYATLPNFTLCRTIDLFFLRTGKAAGIQNL